MLTSVTALGAVFGRAGRVAYGLTLVSSKLAVRDKRNSIAAASAGVLSRVGALARAVNGLLSGFIIDDLAEPVFDGAVRQVDAAGLLLA